MVDEGIKDTLSPSFSLFATMKAVRRILLALLLLSWLCAFNAKKCGSQCRSLLQSYNLWDHKENAAPTSRRIKYGTLKFSDKKYDTPYLRKIADFVMKDTALDRYEDYLFYNLHYGPRDFKNVSEDTFQNFPNNEASRFGKARIPRWILRKQYKCNSVRCKEAKFKVTSTRQNSDRRRYPVHNSSDTVRERIGDDGDMVFEQIKETLKRTLPQLGKFLIHFGKFSKDGNASEDSNIDGSLFIGYLSMKNNITKFENQTTLAPDFFLKNAENIAGKSNDPFPRLGYDYTTMKDGKTTVSPQNYLGVKSREENLTSFYKKDFVEEKSYQMDIKSNIPPTETLATYRDAERIVGSERKFLEHSTNLTKIGDDDKYTIPSQGDYVTESDTVDSSETEVVVNASKLGFVPSESFSFANENSRTQQVNKEETQTEANMRQDDADNLSYRSPNKNTLKDSRNDSLVDIRVSFLDENNETESNNRSFGMQTHRHEEIRPSKCTNNRKLNNAEIREVIHDSLIKVYSEYKKLVEEFLNTILNPTVLAKISGNQTFGFENGTYEKNLTSRMKSTQDLDTNSQLLYEIIEKLVLVSKWNDIYQAQNNEIESNNSDSEIQTPSQKESHLNNYNFSEIPSILHEFYNISRFKYFDYNSQTYAEFLENKTYVFGNSQHKKENSTSKMTLESTKVLETISMLVNETTENMEAIKKIGCFSIDKNKEIEANIWDSDIETPKHADIRSSKYVEFRGTTYQIITASPSALNSTYSVSLIRKWVQKTDDTPDKFPKTNTEGDFLFTPNIPKDNSTISIGLHENTTDFPNVSSTTDVPNAFTNFDKVLPKMNDSRVLFEQTDQPDQTSVTVNDTFVTIFHNKSEKINSFEDKLIPKTSEEILPETKLLEITPKETATTYFNSPEYVERTKLLTDSQPGIDETDIPVNKFQTNSSPSYISYSTGFTLSNSETELSASPKISFINSVTNAYEEKSEILYKNHKMEEATTENYGKLNETLTSKINNISSTIPDYGSTEKETVGTMDHVTSFEVSNVLSLSTPEIKSTKPISKIAQKSPQNNMHITGFPQTSDEQPETYVVRTIPVVNNNTGKITYHDVNVSKHILEEDNYDNLTEYEKYIVFLREYYIQNYVHNRRGKRSLRIEFRKYFGSYFSKVLMMRKPPLRELVSEVMYVTNKRGKRNLSRELWNHIKSTDTPVLVKFLDLPSLFWRTYVKDLQFI